MKDRAQFHVLMQDTMNLVAAYQCASAFESASDYGIGHREMPGTNPMDGPTHNNSE
jgi:hypothetical protein